ncbi:hypothetical protein EK21DRAFT_114310 [Setomelanomma holmii]|uniref:Uncharacterized protein n=1 Tax=Setomelanomma holmii TaxID=210430 RepID=A0A9P4LJS3_9PLEO|nr:hypothetical protein EK21DRAFT_114310 [Setomelanomma holmii]
MFSMLARKTSQGRHMRAPSEMRDEVMRKVYINPPHLLVDSAMSIAIATIFIECFGDRLSLPEWADICNLRRTKCDEVDAIVQQLEDAVFDWATVMLHESTVEYEVNVAKLLDLDTTASGCLTIITTLFMWPDLIRVPLPLTMDRYKISSGYDGSERAVITPKFELTLRDVSAGWIVNIFVDVEANEIDIRTWNGSLLLIFREVMDEDADEERFDARDDLYQQRRSEMEEEGFFNETGEEIDDDNEGDMAD